MSTISVPIQHPSRQAETPRTLPLEVDRGTYAMYLVILTEAFLFIALFFSYFFLEHGKDRWSVQEPPKLTLALIMLAVLASSSVVLHWGEKQVKRGRHLSGRVAMLVTCFLGSVFLVLQALEYRDHWKSLTPFSDAYGSIFYAITSFHGAHLIVGLLVLAYVIALPHYQPNDRSPYRPYHVGALYWHFVDLVWFFIVAILYVGPRLGRL